MIASFGHKLTEQLYDDQKSKVTRVFPPELYRKARMKLLYIHEAEELSDLKVPLGNRLEPLKGNLKRFYSIRVNDQWRFVFRWENGNAYEVKLIDYH